MIANITMNRLLKKHQLQSIYSIPLDETYPIWNKTDTVGRPYWGVASFWGMDEHPISVHQDLSQLEWDGNEIYLEAQSQKEITSILRKAIGMIRFWKEELEARYPDTPFYILASYDNGDLQILDPGETPAQSVTLRFWADRGGNTVIYLNDFETWDQPAIMEYCNYTHSINCIPCDTQ